MAQDFRVHTKGKCAALFHQPRFKPIQYKTMLYADLKGRQRFATLKKLCHLPSLTRSPFSKNTDKPFAFAHVSAMCELAPMPMVCMFKSAAIST